LKTRTDVPWNAVTMVSSAVLFLGTTTLAHAAPPPDPGSIWTFQGENDSVSTTPGGSDKDYTSGLRIGWTSGTDQVPEFARQIATAVWGDGVTRVSFDVSQQLYTPTNTHLVHPDPTDRPVAAYLAGTFSVLQDTDHSRSVLAMSLGMIGPSALGREVQNGFHELIREHLNSGWGAQLPDEPQLELLGERTWRTDPVRAGGLEADALPSLTAGVGTVRDYVQTGVVLRVGQHLDSDFGVSRIRPGITGGDAYTVGPDQVPWYFFAGVDGQLVARDAFLDGDLMRRSAHIQRKTSLGEMEVGMAIIWHGIRLSYTQTWQTASFKGQKGGLFNFGSLTGSVHF
jgi:lipid A 3-O-deacylase